MGSTFFVVPVVGKKKSHDVMQDAFEFIEKDIGFHILWISKPMFFCCLPFSLQMSGLILWFQWMVFRFWLILSSFTPFESNWFHEQFYFVGLLINSLNLS
jgi:hypothetical protein